MPKSQKGSSRDLLDKVKKVSAAGRGGDTKLAHLSPMAQKILKGAGGAGTRNPKTGLKEFKAASVFGKRAAAARDEESEARRALAEFEAARNQAMAQMAPPVAEPAMDMAAVQPEAEPIAPPPAFPPPPAMVAPPAFTPPVEAAPPPRTAREELEALPQPRPQAAPPPVAPPPVAPPPVEVAPPVMPPPAAIAPPVAPPPTAVAPPPARRTASRRAAVTEDAPRASAPPKAAPPPAAAPGSAAADLQQIMNPPAAPPPAAVAPPTAPPYTTQFDPSRLLQPGQTLGQPPPAREPERAVVEPVSEPVAPPPGSAAADLQQITTPTVPPPAVAAPPPAAPAPDSAAADLNQLDPESRAALENAVNTMRGGGINPGININIPGVTGGAVTQPPAAAAPPPGSAAADMSELEKARLAAAEERRNQREDVRTREDLWNPPGSGTRPQPGDRPGLRNPPITEPPVTEPPVTEPPVTEPPVTQPPPSQPPPSQPPPSQPPPSQPPPSQPPPAKPPITQPPGPITQPPPSQPPSSQPPPSQPPPSQPPPTQPPPSGPPVAIPPGLIDSPLPKPPAQPPAQPPGTGGIQPLPPGTLPPTGGGKPAPQPPAPPVPPEVIPPGADRPIRTADFIDRNLNGIDDRDEPPPGDGGKARTGDFQDRNKNGIDDRDEGPSGGGRGLFNFGNFFGEDTDIGRLINRIGRGGGSGSRGGGKKPPPGDGKTPELPPTGGGLPARPELPPIVGTPQPPGGGAAPPVAGPPVYTPPPPIRMPSTPLPPPLPTPIGAGTPTPYFNPNAGGLTPGTVPTGRTPSSLATSNVPLQALAQNPNLGPGMLGGAENAGYYTDRFGNVILSPGAVKPPGRAKGGPASDAELLALLKGENKEAYAESMKNINSARAMLENLSDMPGETTTEYSSTPISQTIRRATRQPIRQETDRGTARGMAMELESLTTAQEPKRAPDTLAELLKMSESVRSRDAMSAKDLMRDTFGEGRLTKKQLSRLGDLMTRRFAKGGEAKATGELGLFTGLAQKLMESEAFKKMTPLQVRTFLESTQGLPEMRTMPISEKNLDQEEQDKLRSLIEYSENLLTDPTNTYYAGKRRRRYYDTPGQVNYYVHEKFRRSQPGASPFSEGDRSVMPSANLRNTLGNFSFERLPDGTLVVKDAYDFTGDIALEDNALVREAERLGVNRPVEIRLPPKKKAVGGEVKKDTDVKKKEDRTLTPYEVLEGVGTGLATGIGRQVEGTAAMVRDPLGTLEYLRNELETFIKEPEKIPQFVKDSVLERWGQLTSGPQGAGEMLAEFLRLPGGGKGVPKRDIFIGSKAKTWDAESNAQALALEKEGRSPEEIWQATQNFRGADGNWRQEISDDQMFFNVEKFRKSPRFMEVDPLKTRAEDFVRSLGSASMSMYGPRRAKYLFGQLISPTRKPARYEIADFMDYPALENAYPEFAQGLLERSSPFSGTLGQASTGKNLTTLQVPLAYRERGEYDPKRTLVHELQHHIQEKEGWAPGGSPNVWKEQRMGYTPPDFIGDTYRKAQADRADKTLSRKERAQAEQVIKDIEKTYSARNLYQSLMGEAEARAASARTYLTPEERLARPPMMDFDVDFSKQLDLRREGTFPSYYYSGQNPYLEKKE